MASQLPPELVPLDMMALMIIQEYPDLQDELNTIIQTTNLTRQEAEKKIKRAIDLYQMQLFTGRIKPKALQS